MTDLCNCMGPLFAHHPSAACVAKGFAPAPGFLFDDGKERCAFCQDKFPVPGTAHCEDHQDRNGFYINTLNIFDAIRGQTTIDDLFKGGPGA